MPNDNQQSLTPPDATPEPEVVTNTQAEQAQQTDVLGIISIIMAFVGMQIVGIILGIIGMKKAKQEGYSVTLSKVGLILNIIFLLLFLPFIAFFIFIALASS